MQISAISYKNLAVYMNKYFYFSTQLSHYVRIIHEN